MIEICDRGVAQLGSAPLWGSGGRGFKSRRSDCIETNNGRGFHPQHPLPQVVGLPKICLKPP